MSQLWQPHPPTPERVGQLRLDVARLAWELREAGVSRASWLANQAAELLTNVEQELTGPIH